MSIGKKIAHKLEGARGATKKFFGRATGNTRLRGHWLQGELGIGHVPTGGEEGFLPRSPVVGSTTDSTGRWRRTPIGADPAHLGSSQSRAVIPERRNPQRT